MEKLVHLELMGHPDFPVTQDPKEHLAHEEELETMVFREPKVQKDKLVTRDQLEHEVKLELKVKREKPDLLAQLV